MPRNLYHCLVGLFLLVLPVLPAIAGEYNDRGYAVVTNVERDNGVDFYARNLQGYAMTFTLTLNQCENLAVDGPLTFTVPGGESVRAVTLTRRNPRAPWYYNFSWNWNYGELAARHDGRAVYALPYLPGQSYRVNQGYNGSFSHYGQDAYALDWTMPEGTPVCAARDGVVVEARAESNEGGGDRAYADKANQVFIRHDDGTIAMYLHFRHRGLIVRAGQRVTAGEVIGYSGNTGFSTEPHLHFAVIRGKDGFARESIPVRFRLADGSAAELAEGECPVAPGDATAAVSGTNADAAAVTAAAETAAAAYLALGRLLAQAGSEYGKAGVRVELVEGWGYGLYEHRLSFTCELRQRGQLAEQSLPAEIIGADPRHWVAAPSFFFAEEDIAGRLDRSQPLTAHLVAYDETDGVELARTEISFRLAGGN